MQTETIIYIIIAVLAALSLALFQYMYKSKTKSKLRYLLIVLRSISILGVLLLLINPKFESVSYFNEKPTLVVAVDNSESISYLKQDESANQILKAIEDNEALNKRFNLRAYSFGKSVSDLDTLNYKLQQSNISKTLKQFGEMYDNQTAPIVLLTDGNQTYGSDYSFVAKDVKQSIYPIILGDSTLYSDLSIKQLNVNRYAFLKNKFPIEVIAVSTTLNANSVGVKTYRVELVPLVNEKNKVNNSKNFGVEVIDQKTNIAIVYELLHPDLGALKKSIERNKQRSVSILKPKEYLSKINDFQLVILYQPNNNFNLVLKEVKQQKLNTFIITGGTTNWNFLNNAQDYFQQKITNQSEDFQPALNKNYNTFIIDNLDFNNYPPLESEFGGLDIKAPNAVILYKKVNGINAKQPMLSTLEIDNTKHALLSGEGIWRWRAQSYLNTERFSDFDNFIGKLVQYLSSNKKRKRINVDYKSFYNGNDDVIIAAQYFNKNYEFDAEASLRIILKNKENLTVTEAPLLVNNGNYTVD